MKTAVWVAQISILISMMMMAAKAFAIGPIRSAVPFDAVTECPLFDAHGRGWGSLREYLMQNQLVDFQFSMLDVPMTIENSTIQNDNGVITITANDPTLSIQQILIAPDVKSLGNGQSSLNELKLIRQDGTTKQSLLMLACQNVPLPSTPSHR